jgi:DNA-binding NtrC family response regulator
VLATALKLRGLRIFEASEPRRGLELARQEHPDVIVLGFDQPELDASLQQDFDQATQSAQAGLIVLGNSPRRKRSQAERFIARPFHYGPLVQTIERMVGHAKAA